MLATQEIIRGGRVSVAQFIVALQLAILVFIHIAVGVEEGDNVLHPIAVKTVPINEGFPEFAKTTSPAAISKFLILTSPIGAVVNVQFVMVPVKEAPLSK